MEDSARNSEFLGAEKVLEQGVFPLPHSALEGDGPPAPAQGTSALPHPQAKEAPPYHSALSVGALDGARRSVQLCMALKICSQPPYTCTCLDPKKKPPICSTQGFQSN